MCYKWNYTDLDAEIVLADGELNMILRAVYEDLCGGDIYAGNILLQWLAGIVQRPHERSSRMPVLRGPQGTGKSMFMWSFFAKRVLGEHILQIHDRAPVTGEFNSLMANRLFVCCEEAWFSGDAQGSNKLKALLTADEFVVNAKYMSPCVVKNHANLIALSNSTQPVRVEPNDRRYLLINTTTRFETMEDADKRAYFTALNTLYNSERCARVFAYFLMSLDLTNWFAEQHTFRFQSVNMCSAIISCASSIDQFIMGLVANRMTLPRFMYDKSDLVVDKQIDDALETWDMTPPIDAFMSHSTSKVHNFHVGPEQIKQALVAFGVVFQSASMRFPPYATFKASVCRHFGVDDVSAIYNKERANTLTRERSGILLQSADNHYAHLLPTVHRPWLHTAAVSSSSSSSMPVDKAPATASYISDGESSSSSSSSSSDGWF
jgi:hypothetical protein